MKKSLFFNYIILIFSILIISTCLSDCKKPENPIKFPKGTFPDSVINLTEINSTFDDYNISLYQITANYPIIFSSNRKSSGGQFDLEQANISFVFDQTNGIFTLSAKMGNDLFLDKLINQAKTPGNDFGPYRLFSTTDGFEYLLLSSVNAEGNLDLYYLKNTPVYNSSQPAIAGPYPVKILNTGFDDAYISFNAMQDTAYFTSNRDGNFDIFLQKRPLEKDLASWFNLEYTASTKVDSINSTSNDKCPFIFRNVMFFASDRPGGLGGFDLYYSILKNGKWSSPVNMGPDVNTSSDEYRPVIDFNPDFTNIYMMFSSNRPGGKGGFDLYFKGIELPK
ncbi:MAG: hypothetical protein EPN88_17335 [Bacteroidetes bacterium]|nr:MAG: hypothetical protein EPN88_17335 [Bacteroidota bacterium]